MHVLILLISLAVILSGAELFTNSIEWLGKKLNLGEGAVGSILAAIGTALPETLIPVIAILFGSGEDASHIGIGAILGAPFMLSTLAMGVVAFSAIGFKYKGQKRHHLMIDNRIIKRDYLYFIIVYSIAILASFLPSGLRYCTAALLVLSYLVYAYVTVKESHNNEAEDPEEENLKPLTFSRKKTSPAMAMILLQIAVALTMIIVGADLFVDAIQYLADKFSVPAFVLSLIIAPIATELPEKINSVIWIRDGKDTLAMGNITGAMVFQSSIIPALGIALTDWVLTPLALFSACLALLSAIILYTTLHFKKQLRPPLLFVCASFYLIFLSAVIITNI